MLKATDAFVIMRVYIGTFNEERADAVAEDLRKTGIRTELRHSLDVDIKSYYFLQGKLSELKEKYKEGKIAETIKEVSEHIEKAKSVLKDGIEVKEFEEKFLDLVMPERKKYEELKNLLKEKFDKKEKFDEIVKEIGIEKIDEFFQHFLDEAQFMGYFHSLLEKNGIKYENEKMYGSLPADPFVKFYIDVSSREAEELGLEYEFEAFINKNVDVYANLVDVLYETKKIEKLCERKPEFADLLFMADIMASIVDKIKGKMDIDELIEEIGTIKEEEGEIHLTKEAINEILKALEKAEVIKIKKGKVMRK